MALWFCVCRKANQVQMHRGKAGAETKVQAQHAIQGSATAQSKAEAQVKVCAVLHAQAQAQAQAQPKPKPSGKPKR